MMRVVLLLTLSILGAGLASSCAAQATPRPAKAEDQVEQQGEPEKVFLEDYLHHVAALMNCYFTVERLQPTKLQERYSAFDTQADMAPRKFASIDDLVKDLNARLVGITATRCKEHPAVIHLIEDELRKLDNYGLERKVSVRFQGNLHAFTLRLGELFPWLWWKNRIFLRPKPILDTTTEIAVDARDQPVREVLTAAVPLAGYRRIIWAAYTVKRDGNWFSAIQFNGRKSPPEDAEEAKQRGEPEKVFLRWYLYKVATLMDCYFTIERLQPTNFRERRSAFDTQADRAPRKFASMDDLVKDLNARLVGITATRCKDNPAVIHLIEDELRKLDSYDMERKVTIRYLGNPYDFTIRLGELYPGIGPRKGISFHERLPDSSTTIAVDDRDRPVREVLTAAVPLAGYGRIIWEVQTVKRDGKWICEIGFIGRVRKRTCDGELEEAYFEDYLYYIADLMNCHFTIERTPTEPRRRSAFDSQANMRPRKFASIDDLVTALNKQLVGITATRCKDNPAVVHLVEDELRKLDGYDMERKVTIQFRGNPRAFAARLGDLYPGLGPKDWSFPHEPPPDATTAIAVDARDQPVREVLTAAVPLAGYGQVIWEVTTVKRDGKWFNAIKFDGPEVETDDGELQGEGAPPEFRLQSYLNGVATRMDCYFTIERLHPPKLGQRPSAFDTQADVDPRKSASIDDLVKDLNGRLVGITATRSKDHPQVIHLVEDDLRKLDGYELERKVTIRYRGNPLGLADHLNELYPGLGPKDWPMPPNLMSDTSSRTAVDARDQPVREILTAAVPLAGYSRIIWEVTTHKMGGKWYCAILFNGPKIKRDDEK